MSRHGLHVTDPAKIIICSSADHIKVGGLTFFRFILMLISVFYLLWKGEYAACKAKGQEKNYASGKGSIQNCKFPFIHNDLKYSSGCAPSTEKGKGRLCATEVDAQGKLTKWARCNKYCGKDKGVK